MRWIAAILAIALAGCSGAHLVEYPATCFRDGKTYTGTARGFAFTDGKPVEIRSYLVRDHNGIDRRIDDSNSDRWQCAITAP